jgi:hypothetical protein
MEAIDDDLLLIQSVAEQKPQRVQNGIGLFDLGSFVLARHFEVDFLPACREGETGRGKRSEASRMS